jgi:hypothetical protein
MRADECAVGLNLDRTVVDGSNELEECYDHFGFTDCLQSFENARASTEQGHSPYLLPTKLSCWFKDSTPDNSISNGPLVARIYSR